MTGIRSDIRYAVRSLSRGWRFALGVVLTLGLGVGLGVPVLSLADHFFLRPPPGVADPDRALRLVLRGVSANGPFFTDGLTGLDYAVMTSRARTLSGVAGWINDAAQHRSRRGRADHPSHARVGVVLPGARRPTVHGSLLP